MARKNLLRALRRRWATMSTAAPFLHPRRGFLLRAGASRSMIQSLDELAETSMRVLDGETVISIDPNDLDGSFVADRDDDQAYEGL